LHQQLVLTLAFIVALVMATLTGVLRVRRR